MSWHYLQELVGGSSEHICSDGEPSAPWKRSRTAERCSYEGSETVCFPCSQSGTTATRSTEDRGVDLWMLSLRDSPVSRSPLQENKAQGTTSETDGPPPFAFLEKSDQGLPCWKTSQGCFPGLMATLDEYSETWPRSGSMRSGTVFQLQPSALLIGGIDSGFYATPTAKANQLSPSMTKHPGCRRLMFPTPTVSTYESNRSLSPGAAVRLSLHGMANKDQWPTPLASDGEKAATDSLARLIETGHRRGRLDGFTREGAKINHSVQTHNANDWKGSYKEGQRRGQLTDPAMGVIHAGGKLNPTWVAWLMGWPTGWTDLEPLAMDKWHQWCRSHGINC